MKDNDDLLIFIGANDTIRCGFFSLVLLLNLCYSQYAVIPSLVSIR